jgi:hypothetical protein
MARCNYLIAFLIVNLALYATERVLCVFNGRRLYLDALQAGTPMLRDKWSICYFSPSSTDFCEKTPPKQRCGPQQHAENFATHEREEYSELAAENQLNLLDSGILCWKSIGGSASSMHESGIARSQSRTLLALSRLSTISVTGEELRSNSGRLTKKFTVEFRTSVIN